MEDEQPQLESPPKRYISKQEQRMLDNMLSIFDEQVNATLEWLDTPEAQQLFFERQNRISTVIEQSSLNKRWEQIIQARAENGADITSEIYGYIRQLNSQYGNLVQYNPTETRVFNNLCDTHYELIKRVSTDEIQLIRQKLLDDYANGRSPNETSLRELQLQPINRWSPSQRAKVIARTESHRALSTASLESYKEMGVTHVELDVARSGCTICKKKAGTIIPIDEAINDPVLHPNCRCAWKPARNPETNNYINT